MTLSELIDTLSRPGIAPSSILDAEIHCVLHPDRITHKHLPPGYTMKASGDSAKDARLARAPFITRDRGPSPRYTKLVDDALKALPKSPDTETGVFDYELGQTNGGLTVWARVGPQSEETFADTPALALVTAALKALQLQQETT